MKSLTVAVIAFASAQALLITGPQTVNLINPDVIIGGPQTTKATAQDFSITGARSAKLINPDVVIGGPQTKKNTAQAS
jgi:hypothetical protein